MNRREAIEACLLGKTVLHCISNIYWKFLDNSFWQKGPMDKDFNSFHENLFLPLGEYVVEKNKLTIWVNAYPSINGDKFSLYGYPSEKLASDNCEPHRLGGRAYPIDIFGEKLECK